MSRKLDKYRELIHILYRMRYHYSFAFNSLHPAIYDLIHEGYEPANWHLICLEQPRISATARNLVAYVEKEFLDGRFAPPKDAKLGRYIKRHFPKISDKVLAEIVCQYPADTFRILNTIEEFEEAVQDGPESCMQQEDNDPWPCHPYSVYKPEYGWRMAIRRSGESTVGRALMYEGEGRKCYVRSYILGGGRDDYLEAFLKAKGYAKASGWPSGAKLDFIPYDGYGEFLAPYIDGDLDTVDIEESPQGKYLRFSRNGLWTCSSDRCVPEEQAAEYCYDCEERLTHGMSRTTTFYENTVCDNCLEDYVQAQGRYEWTFIREEDAIQTVEGDWFVDNERVLGYHDIVRITEGEKADEYTHIDNVINDAYGDTWWHEDGGVAYDDERNEYYSIEDMKMCLHNGIYYHADDMVEVEGGFVHEKDVEEWRAEHEKPEEEIREAA